MTGEFESWCVHQLNAVEQALSEWVPESAPARLGEAMRYAVLDGGKRLRPLLVLATAQAVRGHSEAAMRAACAVELIHAYSLVHDDMPCMDNDVLRRNKPTVHVQYGQAGALLAGDAMQALAFEILSQPLGGLCASVQARHCHLLATAAGHSGMAGGQAIDLASVGQLLSASQLQRMHELKTGALIECSVLMGAACGQVSVPTLAQLKVFGASLGLAFQVVDDILDVTADSATLGKTAGKDALQDKPTYVSVLGMAQAQALAVSFHGQALQALHASGLSEVSGLKALADMVVHRNN
jgi:farnesyl diphosphate synthase